MFRVGYDLSEIAEIEMNSTSYQADFSVGERCFIILFLFVLIVIGSFGNVLVMYAVLKNPMMRIAINILLVALAFSDTVICLLCVPFDLITVMLNRWIFGRLFCIVHASIYSVMLIEGIFILCIISVDRYRIIVRRKNEINFQNTVVVLMISTITAIACCVSTGHIVNYVFRSRQMHCNLGSALNGLQWSIISIYTVCGYFIPLITMSSCYFIIICTLRRTVRRINCQDITMINTSLRMRYNFKFKTRTLWTVFLLYIIFVFTKTPYFLYKIIANKESTKGYIYTTCILYLSSTLNPIVYVWKIGIIRRIFWKVVSRCLCIKNKEPDSRNKYKISINLRQTEEGTLVN
ncbi:probable G-protein coupled receptor 45 [Centruroides sculpturatus]|uniref:probable G-protein coupled receptor 45 n=1 Tax=Centruroides sculpturatus TaxID=218467 RepID=UPI000C6D9CA0|nr:probable G-protein coupled receptor 45 [Centruroides sculpturatus]